MRPIDAELAEGKVKLRGAFHGEGAYEAFKRIASEFYKDHTYKFAALTLDRDPKPDSVEFTAEFWSVPSEAATQQPNDPLTLEELREMDGEPVWVIFYAAYMETVGMRALVSVEGYTKKVFLTNKLGGRSAYEKAAVDIKEIYRRKPEEGTI